jgi:hypothetical protein
VLEPIGLVLHLLIGIQLRCGIHGELLLKGFTADIPAGIEPTALTTDLGYPIVYIDPGLFDLGMDPGRAATYDKHKQKFFTITSVISGCFS